MPRPRVFLLYRRGETHHHELRLLCRAAGLDPIGHDDASMDKPRPTYLVGSGTVDRVASAAADSEASAIVVDEPLSPRQQRNWEDRTGLTVLDRQAVILEIFRRRATTREAKLQVELAQAEYDLPRLKNAWGHFSRQAGASSILRGEGEKQLEIDRRLVQKRITTTKRELAQVSKQRQLRRQRRTKLFQASFVGYTNAGKSTLLNRLTSADVLVRNQLFATLDPTTRRLRSPDGTTLLVTDTVGFVRKLPHSLVEAFHSTLEEATTADLLLIVMDASDPEFRFQFETTVHVLTELSAVDQPIAVILNKVDNIAPQDRRQELRLAEGTVHSLLPSVDLVFPVSARTGEGVDALRGHLFEQAASDSTYSKISAGRVS